MTGLIIHPKVAAEVAAAAAWYRRIDPDLAERFLEEVYEGIRKAREMPLLFRIIENPFAESSATVFPTGLSLKSSGNCSSSISFL